jgi:hypothetical protein
VNRAAKTSMGRVSGSYKGYVDGVYKNEILAQDIDTSKPVIYLSQRNLDGQLRSLFASTYPNGSTVLLLGLNRINKFKRDFPAATEAWAHARTLAENWRDNLTHHDLLSLHLSVTDIRDSLRFYDADRVDDPELKDAIRLSKIKGDTIYDEFSKYGRYIGMSARMDWKNPLDNYVLLTDKRVYGTLNGTFGDHVYLYINAAYAAAKEEECNTAS